MGGGGKNLLGLLLIACLCLLHWQVLGMCPIAEHALVDVHAHVCFNCTCAAAVWAHTVDSLSC